MAKTAAQIRQEFITFFESKDHEFIRSAPVVPHDDPTLMFTNAGMNQFKSIILGDNPKGIKRAANSQKCMRVSGKHNDLEEVGVDHYHHTFFEMLGNWSFGDYYKKEAITWAWELLTDVWGLDKSKLYATVYKNDDESFGLWTELTDIDPTHVSRHGEKDNFWEMGETGPCGPCTEIHIDLGPGNCPHENDPHHTCEVNGDNCHRYLELWNNVFMEFERQKDGSLKDLPAKHVDTGMGLERIVRIIHGSKSNYDSDLFMPIISKLEELSGLKYHHGAEGTPFRVIADHMRALTSAITDGVFPSNDGRGYVLRRLLRRAYRYGRKLGFKKPFMYQLVPVVADMMGDAFPELRERTDYVISVIKGEEERFDATLETGIEKFHAMVDAAKRHSTTTLPGADVFTLYDTYGFPVDLTRLMAEELGFSVDEKAFDVEMEAQKSRAREAQKGSGEDGLSAEGWTEVMKSDGTTFVGYEQCESISKVVRFKQPTPTTALIVLDTTPFYAEMGGQCGDEGTLSDGKQTVSVESTISWNEIVVHKAMSDEPIAPSFFTSALTAKIDTARRDAIRRNHSATHLLQSALTTVLGDHVSQSGSRVDADSLRFDFTHFSAVSSEELEQVEDLVNGWIMANLSNSTTNMGIDEAKASGAKALFGEKYGDSVRVVRMGDISSELCGGTHTKSTGNIGSFRITSESSVAAGIRRIEAVTGFGALDFGRSQSETLSAAALSLKVSETAVVERIKELQGKVKSLDAELKRLHALEASQKSGSFIDDALANPIGKLFFTAQSVGAMDKDLFAGLMDSLSDTIKQKQLSHIAILLMAEDEGKVMIAACADQCAVADGIHCGSLVKLAASKVQGGGGGSPVRAQAGGKDATQIPAALTASIEFVATLS